MTTQLAWKVIDDIIIPPRGAHAAHVAKGQRLRVSTPRGHQASDFFTFNRDDLSEWLSPHHSWVSNTYMRPREGQTFHSNRRQPILLFVEDGAAGVHDMYLAPCDRARYEQLGSPQQVGCGELMVEAMSKLGCQVSVGPLDINLFTLTRCTDDQRLASDPNPVPAGSYAIFEALMDIVCVCTSCPWELHDPWPINIAGEITEIQMQVLAR